MTSLRTPLSPLKYPHPPLVHKEVAAIANIVYGIDSLIGTVKSPVTGFLVASRLSQTFCRSGEAGFYGVIRSPAIVERLLYPGRNEFGIMVFSSDLDLATTLIEHKLEKSVKYRDQSNNSS